MILALTLAAAVSDNCTIKNDYKVCQAEEPHACHNTGDFTSPQSIADFYGGVVLYAGVAQLEDGTVVYKTFVKVGELIYLFQGEVPEVPGNFEMCLIEVGTLAGEPA